MKCSCTFEALLSFGWKPEDMSHHPKCNSNFKDMKEYWRLKQREYRARKSQEEVIE